MGAASCRLCCKSRFALATKNSAGRGRVVRVKMWGASSPHDKLTRDFDNAIEAMRIGDSLPFGHLAKNLRPCNFRLLQHNRHKAADPECPLSRQLLAAKRT